ncbi:hypothetical protein, partial [Salinivibrio sp. VYel6]|uniref:hypothetical protein n=1 Tax=Salinivibrio sp. VYel6 TaxID=2490493 RepID=UPI0015628DD5
DAQDSEQEKKLKAYKVAEEHRQTVVKNLAEVHLNRLSADMEDMTTNEKVELLEQDETMQDLFSRYSADETVSQQFKQEFLTTKMKEWSETDTENYLNRQFNSFSATTVEDTLNLIDSGKEDDAITEDIYLKLKKASSFGKSEEDVAGLYVSYIKKALQSGTEEEKLGAISLYQTMYPLQTQMGAQSDEFRDLGVVVRKTNETLQNEYIEKQSRNAKILMEEAAKSGDMSALEELEERFEGAGFITESQFRDYRYKAHKNAEAINKQRQLMNDTLNGKKLTDNVEYKQSDFKQLDKSLSKALFSLDESGTPTISDSNLVKLVDSMAVNRDVPLKMVNNKLFGGLDFASETDKEGNPSPRLIKSIQHAQRIGDMKGVTFLKEQMGKKRYNTFALLRAATNDEYDDPQTLKEGQELIKRATAYQEKNGKPTVTSKLKGDLVDSLEEAAGVERSTAQAYVEQNAEQVQMFLSAFQGDGERAG